MTPTDDGTRRHRLGSLLVASQFALIAVLLALGAPEFWAGLAPAGAWAVAAVATVLGAWTLACNRIGNFNIHPAPRAGGRLVRSGPYRWIRHPMYSAVFGYAIAAAWASGSPRAWASAAALVAVLACKAALEERWMRQQHPDYDDYRRSTWRFMPGLW